MKKTNKKIFLIILTVFLLSACDSKDQTVSQKAVSDYGIPAPADTKNVSVNKNQVDRKDSIGPDQ